MSRFFLKWLILGALFPIFIGACKKDETADSDIIAQMQKNKEAGERFLMEKRKAESVYEDPSGLLYSVVKEGTGERPSAKDTIAYYRKGMLIDGTVFEEKTDTIAVNEMMEGLRIGMRHVPVGGEYKLYVPYYLMYGASSAVGSKKKGDSYVSIEGYSALVYEVRLDAIFKRDK